MKNMITYLKNSSLKPYLLLSLLCLFLYLPGASSIPPIDRDEARYVQATRQMLETGDLIDIRFQETPRHKKPAGIYWLQSASVSLFGNVKSNNMLPYRLPSLFCAWFAVLLTYTFGKKLLANEKMAFYGAAFLASSVLLTVEAHLAKTDATMLFFVVLAQGALGLIYSKDTLSKRNEWLMAMLFWVAMGVGIMIKGPVLPTVSILTIAALCTADRNIKWLKKLKPAAGIPITLLIAAPWFIAIQKISGGGFMQEAVGKDFLPKLFSGQESHGAPPGYYILLMALTLWPVSFFAWKGFFEGIKNRTNPAIRFCLAWIIPSWIVFELVPTKLPHYVLPLYPAVCLLIAHALFKEKADEEATTCESTPAKTCMYSLVVNSCIICKSAPYLWKGLYILVTIALGGLFIGSPIAMGGKYDGSIGSAFSSISTASLYIPVACVMIGIYVLKMTKEDTEKNIVSLLKQSAIVLFIAFAFVMPKLDHMWISKQVKQAVDDSEKFKNHKLIAAGFHEPSLVFLMGTNTLLTTGGEAAKQLAHTPRSIALIETKEEEAFLQQLNGASASVISTIKGHNYSRGKELTLKLYAITDPVYINRRRPPKVPF
ncbi:MAG: glycosyltransferase family 39 protein [Alphaproteobacteria bacterium]|nr:glycosyltransferase family 39 protein [Alphaproteobacteria bacterium]